MKDADQKKAKAKVKRKRNHKHSVAKPFLSNKQIQSFTVDFTKNSFFKTSCHTMLGECLSTLNSINFANGINVAEEIRLLTGKVLREEVLGCMDVAIFQFGNDATLKKHHAPDTTD